jgi:peptidyl-prolyl cis-trans isomerase C
MVVAKRRFSRGGGPLDDSQLSRIKKDLLENLIDRELLYQESQKKGIKVDEAAIDERFKKQFADEAKLKNILRSMNLSEAGIRSQFMRGMAIRKLVDQEIAPKATVSEKEMKAYYDSNPRFFVQPEQVQASHILIKVDSKADKSQKAEARKELEEIQQRIEKGEDFSVLAKESSECPSSAKGGDLGYFGRGKMAKPFEEAAFALKPGQVSEIVETRYGYHLIKAMGKRPERTVPYKEAKARIEQRLKREKIQKEVDLYVAKLKEKAKVERLLTEVPK